MRRGLRPLGRVEASLREHVWEPVAVPDAMAAGVEGDEVRVRLDPVRTSDLPGRVTHQLNGRSREEALRESVDVRAGRPPRRDRDHVDPWMEPREPRDGRGLALTGRSERMEGEDERAALCGLRGRRSRGRDEEGECQHERKAAKRPLETRQHLDGVYSSRQSTIRSPTMSAGRFVFARGTTGISEQSATTTPSSPRTRPAPSQTASGSPAAPIAQVPDGW
jgi:hypothetical protein